MIVAVNVTEDDIRNSDPTGANCAVVLDALDALEAAYKERDALRAQVEQVRAVIDYDSAAHHADAPCTDECMNGFRERVRMACKSDSNGDRGYAQAQEDIEAVLDEVPR